jgi:hypothetical protein
MHCLMQHCSTMSCLCCGSNRSRLCKLSPLSLSFSLSLSNAHISLVLVLMQHNWLKLHLKELQESNRLCLLTCTDKDCMIECHLLVLVRSSRSLMST